MTHGVQYRETDWDYDVGILNDGMRGTIPQELLNLNFWYIKLISWWGQSRVTVSQGLLYVYVGILNFEEKMGRGASRLTELDILTLHA